MRILFFGTPDIAAETLAALCDSGYEICGVVTQIDKPQGRKQELKFSAVKELALSKGLEVFQPEKLKNGELNPVLAKTKPDICIVIAYGRILPKEVLSFPPLGCINLHASLLPKYRGAGPIQHAVLEGEKETGITVMQMDEGIDTGDILYTLKTDILESESAGELFCRMSKLAARAICEALPLIVRGELKPKKQDESGASYAPMLSKNAAQLCPSQGVQRCYNAVRGLNPWPVAFVNFMGKKLKIFKAEIGAATDIPLGFAAAVDGKIALSCQDGTLYLTEVQLEGGKRMDAKSFLMGHPISEPQNLN